MALIGWAAWADRSSEAHRERAMDQGEGIGFVKGPEEDREQQKDQVRTAAWEDQSVGLPEGDPYQERLQLRNIDD